MAIGYLVAIPFVMFVAVLVELAVLDTTSSPTLSYGHELLLHTVPAMATGGVLFMALRLAFGQSEDVLRARWPPRAAPLLLSAAAPTAFGASLILAEGHRGLNGLIVLPAVVLWSGVAGEWLAHAWVARQRSGDALLRGSFLGAAAIVGMLILSAWILRSPTGELEVARARCRDQYARSRTAEDSAFADQWKPTIARELGTRSCHELLAGKAAGPPQPSHRAAP